MNYLTPTEVAMMVDKNDFTLVDRFFVPAHLRCPKCKFYLVSKTLNMATGTVGANDTSKREVCPNDGVNMERVSWPEHGQAMDEAVLAMADKVKLVEASLRALAPVARLENVILSKDDQLAFAQIWDDKRLRFWNGQPIQTSHVCKVLIVTVDAVYEADPTCLRKSQ